MDFTVEMAAAGGRPNNGNSGRRKITIASERMTAADANHVGRGAIEEGTMEFKEIASRLTGFSTPVFGVSWDPPEPERAVGRRVIAFLEDRRVLYNPYQIEIDDQVTRSVLEIRQFLTPEIGGLDTDSELAGHLRAIRAACRRYLDETGPGSHRLDLPPWRGPFEFGFFLQLGELRAAVGEHVAAIAVMYGLDIEGDLADTLPALDSVEDDE